LWGYNLLPTRQLIFDKLREVIQHPSENPADFLGHLTETLTCYTKLDPSSRAGMLILNSHFISQSFPDSQKTNKQNKTKNLNRQRMALKLCQGELVKMAFKVFNN
jgi:hypothetical protein